MSVEVFFVGVVFPGDRNIRLTAFRPLGRFFGRPPA